MVMSLLFNTHQVRATRIRVCQGNRASTMATTHRSSTRAQGTDIRTAMLQGVPACHERKCSRLKAEVLDLQFKTHLEIPQALRCRAINTNTGPFQQPRHHRLLSINIILSTSLDRSHSRNNPTTDLSLRTPLLLLHISLTIQLCTKLLSSL